MLAQVEEREIWKRVVSDDVAGRSRDDDLSAVGRRGDARGTDDIDAVVAGGGEPGLTRVDPDPHADDRALGPFGLEQVALSGHSRGDRVARAAEREEERIALTVDLVPSVSAEGCPEQVVMLLEQDPVLVAEPAHEPRRALDVAEEERDRSGGRVAVSIIRGRRRSFCSHDSGLSVTAGRRATALAAVRLSAGWTTPRRVGARGWPAPRAPPPRARSSTRSRATRRHAPRGGGGRPPRTAPAARRGRRGSARSSPRS